MEKYRFKKREGLIIRNGLELQGSWTKRVKHWNFSFLENSLNNHIITVYPSKPNNHINGIDNINYLIKRKLPNLILYFLSPLILLLYFLKTRPTFILLANGGFWEFFTVPIYCKIAGIPLLVDMVDTIGREYKNDKSIIDYFIIQNKKFFDKIILKHAHEIFVISSSLELKYRKLFPRKTITRSIPSTVNILEFERVSRYSISALNNKAYDIFYDDSFIKVFYGGTITRLNGIEFFLKAISGIIDDSINIKIIIANLDGDVRKLNNLIKKYNLATKTLIIPPVEQKLLPILLSRADILFIPEQGYETAHAGFPGKTSEYLLSGNPVITTKFSDLGLYLIDNFNACISEIGDIESYQNNLKKLINNSNFREKIGSNGKILASEKFSHINCALPYIKAIRSYQSSNSAS